MLTALGEHADSFDVGTFRTCLPKAASMAHLEENARSYVVIGITFFVTKSGVRRSPTGGAFEPFEQLSGV
jgi:hypothetical protein